jgi:hypothetical protein
VVRVAPLDPAAQRLLGAPVGRRDRTGVGLVRDGDVRQEQRRDALERAADQLVHERHELAFLGAVERGAVMLP